MRWRQAHLVAFGAAAILPLGLFATPAAQQQAARSAAPSEVRTLLFELANSMGMLRGLQQEDSILSLEVWAAGTLTSGSERAAVPEYRLSLNYAVPGMRVDYMRTQPDGQTRRVIEVVSGTAAWDETERGRNASPAPPGAVRQRLVQLWTTPFGVVKAARAAGDRATVKTTGDGAVLSFPLPPPVDDIRVNATVRKDASLLVNPHPTALKDLVGTYIVRVETAGPIAVEATYGEYGEWNWSDYRADVMLPRQILRRDGATTFELAIRNTNTYNPYVVMPVPDNLAGSR